jgi:hypothetical protein
MIITRWDAYPWKTGFASGMYPAKTQRVQVAIRRW